MTTDERVAALEAQVKMLTDQLSTLTALLREHMRREEMTTAELRADLSLLHQQLSGWRGVAAGATLVVSALWTVGVVAVAWMR